MSVEILFRLVCDGCRRPWDAFPEGATDGLMRRDLERLRTAANAKDWRRYRRSATGINGDFCPTCVEAHINERKKARVNGHK